MTEPKCKECNDTGIEHSGVCHCGTPMDGHSVYDNHCATEMTRPCKSCELGAGVRACNTADEAYFEILEDLPDAE